jgi:tetratricopeptide (TPR) repeat protein
MFALAFVVAAAQQIAGGSVPAQAPIDCDALVLAESRDTAASRFKAGEAAIGASKWVEAEAALLKAVSADPLLAIAHYGLGQTFMAQGRYAEAAQAFSASRDAYRCHRLTEADRKQRAQQIQELREAVRNGDQRRLKEIGAKWKEMNGEIATSGAKMRNAQEVERRLLELEESLKDTDPSPPGVTLALGTALFRTGALAEAESAFRTVISRDPRSGDAHHNLALVCTITDRLEEAEREMAAADKAGVAVDPRLKQEYDRRRAAAKR